MVLTGDGGDELLGGYPRHYKAFGSSPQFIGSPVSRWRSVTGRDLSALRFHGSELPSWEALTAYHDWMPDGFPEDRNDPLNAHLAIENVGHLAEEYLARNDRLGMWHGLECRMPLLTEPFRSYAMGLPSAIKLEGQNKRPAREALRGFLPDCVIDKTKSGWAPPFGKWIGGKTAFAGELGQRINETVRPGVVPALDALVDVTTLRSRIKLTVAAFFLMLWARKIGMEV